jgi:hypothetical protein
MLDARIAASVLTSYDHSGTSACRRRSRGSSKAASVPGRPVGRRPASGGRGVERLAENRVVARAVELAVLAVGLDDPDHAADGFRRPVGAALPRDVLADGFARAEQRGPHRAVDHHRLVALPVVFGAEPPPLDDREPEQVLELVGHLGDAEFDASATPLVLAARAAELIGRQLRAGHHLDLGKLAQRRQQAPHVGDLAVLERVVGRLLHVDGHMPHPIDRVADRPAPVVERVDRQRHYGEEHEERHEDLAHHEEVRALPIPDQPEDVADHRAAPFRACTGWRRDMRQAG